MVWILLNRRNSCCLALSEFFQVFGKGNFSHFLLTPNWKLASLQCHTAVLTESRLHCNVSQQYWLKVGFSAMFHNNTYWKLASLQYFTTILTESWLHCNVSQQYLLKVGFSAVFYCKIKVNPYRSLKKLQTKRIQLEPNYLWFVNYILNGFFLNFWQRNFFLL